MGEPASCTQRATRFISSDHLDEVARIATRISVIAKRSTRRHPSLQTALISSASFRWFTTRWPTHHEPADRRRRGRRAQGAVLPGAVVDSVS